MLSTDHFITISIMIPSPKQTVRPWKVIGTQKERIVSQARPLLAGPANGPVWVHFKTAFDCAPWFFKPPVRSCPTTSFSVFPSVWVWFGRWCCLIYNATNIGMYKMYKAKSSLEQFERRWGCQWVFPDPEEQQLGICKFIPSLSDL